MFYYTEYSKETNFTTYALHVLEVKEFQGMKHRTLSGYRGILNTLKPYRRYGINSAAFSIFGRLNKRFFNIIKCKGGTKMWQT